MSNDSPGKKKPPSKKEDLVLTPGGRRSKSKVFKIEPGQHAEVQGGRLKVIHTATGRVVADLGVVRKDGTGTVRGGGPMKKAGPSKPAK
jgi:hypothetical protein